MQRIPEPEELMDDLAQAQAYAQADFSEANRQFAELVERQVAGDLRGRMLDLGCGPADIPIALLHAHPELAVDAVDGAPMMLEMARHNLDNAPAAAARIALHCMRLPCAELVDRDYAFVVSNSLLHHLADPALMWQTVRNCGRPGTHVVIMDLARPASELAVDALVETYALNEPEVLRRDFRNSLFAAYTVDEVCTQLDRAGLGEFSVQMVSDRHLAVSGCLA